MQVSARFDLTPSSYNQWGLGLGRIGKCSIEANNVLIP